MDKATKRRISIGYDTNQPMYILEFSCLDEANDIYKGPFVFVRSIELKVNGIRTYNMANPDTFPGTLFTWKVLKNERIVRLANEIWEIETGLDGPFSIDKARDAYGMLSPKLLLKGAQQSGIFNDSPSYIKYPPVIGTIGGEMVMHLAIVFEVLSQNPSFSNIRAYLSLAWSISAYRNERTRIDHGLLHDIRLALHDVQRYLPKIANESVEKPSDHSDVNSTIIEKLTDLERKLDVIATPSESPAIEAKLDAINEKLNKLTEMAQPRSRAVPIDETVTAVNVEVDDAHDSRGNDNVDDIEERLVPLSKINMKRYPYVLHLYLKPDACTCMTQPVDAVQISSRECRWTTYHWHKDKRILLSAGMKERSIYDALTKHDLPYVIAHKQCNVIVRLEDVSRYVSDIWKLISGNGILSERADPIPYLLEMMTPEQYKLRLIRMNHFYIKIKNEWRRLYSSPNDDSPVTNEADAQKKWYFKQGNGPYADFFFIPNQLLRSSKTAEEPE